MTTPWKVIGEDGKIRAARTVEAQERVARDAGGRVSTEERLLAAYAAANDPGAGCDVQIHVPGSWDDGSDWVVWCGSVTGRGATLDAALDALTAGLREQGGRWYSTGEATLFDLGGETVTAQWTNRDGLPCAIRAFKRYVHPDVIASGKCAVVVLDGHGVHIRPSGWQP